METTKAKKKTSSSSSPVKKEEVESETTEVTKAKKVAKTTTTTAAKKKKAPVKREATESATTSTRATRAKKTTKKTAAKKSSAQPKKKKAKKQESNNKTKKYHAIRKCDSLKAPAIFLHWDDCQFYVEEHDDDYDDGDDNNNSCEYRSFEKILDAVEFCLGEKGIIENAIKKVITTKGGEEEASTAAKTPTNTTNTSQGLGTLERRILDRPQDPAEARRLRRATLAHKRRIGTALISNRARKRLKANEEKQQQQQQQQQTPVVQAPMAATAMASTMAASVPPPPPPPPPPPFFYPPPPAMYPPPPSITPPRPSTVPHTRPRPVLVPPITMVPLVPLLPAFASGPNLTPIAPRPIDIAPRPAETDNDEEEEEPTATIAAATTTTTTTDGPPAAATTTTPTLPYASVGPPPPMGTFPTMPPIPFPTIPPLPTPTTIPFVMPPPPTTTIPISRFDQQVFSLIQYRNAHNSWEAPKATHRALYDFVNKTKCQVLEYEIVQKERQQEQQAEANPTVVANGGDTGGNAEGSNNNDNNAGNDDDDDDDTAEKNNEAQNTAGEKQNPAEEDSVAAVDGADANSNTKAPADSNNNADNNGDTAEKDTETENTAGKKQSPVGENSEAAIDGADATSGKGSQESSNNNAENADATAANSPTTPVAAAAQRRPASSSKKRKYDLLTDEQYQRLSMIGFVQYVHMQIEWKRQEKEQQRLNSQSEKQRQKEAERQEKQRIRDEKRKEEQRIRQEEKEKNRIQRQQQLEKEREEKWNSNLEKVKKFRRENDGKLPRLTDNKTLYNWCHAQRQSFLQRAKGAKPQYDLTASQVQRLASVGLTSTVRFYTDLDTRVQEWLDYKRSFGDNEYKSPKAGTPMFRWIGKIKWKYMMWKLGHKAKITEEAVEKLAAGGFKWPTQEEIDNYAKHMAAPKKPTKSWEERFQMLLEYKQKHGHTCVPQKDGQLGKWVHGQRKEYSSLKKGDPSKLTQEKLTKLMEIDFAFSARDWRKLDKKRYTTTSSGVGEGVRFLRAQNRLEYDDDDDDDDDDDEDSMGDDDEQGNDFDNSGFGAYRYTQNGYRYV